MEDNRSLTEANSNKNVSITVSHIYIHVPF